MNLSAISNYVPKIGIASPQQAVKNLTKLTVPIIVLFGASMINEAQSAGGYRYNECINDCSRHRDIHEIARLLCYTMCFFFSDKS